MGVLRFVLQMPVFLPALILSVRSRATWLLHTTTKLHMYLTWRQQSRLWSLNMHQILVSAGDIIKK